MTDFNCYIDELEIPKSETTDLTFIFFGVLISAERADLETNVKDIVKRSDGKKFHALKFYKAKENQGICEKLTDIIINNQLTVICFPFVRVWLNDSRLEILKTLQLPDLEKVKFSNYRSMAWLLFIHVFDSFMNNKFPNQKFKIVADSDWLRSNEVVVHHGEKLKSLKQYISSTQSKMPLLGLADHTGYLFHRYKQIAYEEKGIIKLKQFDSIDFVNINAIKLFEHLVTNKRFHTLDLWNWIKKENEKQT